MLGATWTDGRERLLFGNHRNTGKPTVPSEGACLQHRFGVIRCWYACGNQPR